MLQGAGRLIAVAVRAAFGLALMVAVAVRLTASGRVDWLDLVQILMVLGAATLGFAYLTSSRFRAKLAPPARRRVMVAIISVVGAASWAMRPSHSVSQLSWTLATTNERPEPTRPCWPPPAPKFCKLAVEEAWRQFYPGIQLHATTDTTDDWPWRARGTPHLGIRQFGGTVRLLVTQPEHAVFHDDGTLTDGDGVEVSFLVERRGVLEPLQKITLQPHSLDADRRWVPVTLTPRPVYDAIIVEVSPGPEGSTNWFDRVYLGVDGVSSGGHLVSRVADWLAGSLMIFLLLSIAFRVLRSASLRRLFGSERGPRVRRDRAVVWIVPIGVLILVGLIRVAAPDAYLTFVAEDGPIENATALLYFAAAVVAGLVASHMYRTTQLLRGTLFLLLGLACFVVGGEEISWGQRLLDFATPAVLAETNLQSEANLHNIDSVSRYLARAFILIGACGTLGWLFVTLLKDSYRRFLEPLAPAWYLTSYFMPVLAFYVYLEYISENKLGFPFLELTEGILALGFLLYALSKKFQWAVATVPTVRRRRRRRPISIFAPRRHVLKVRAE